MSQTINFFLSKGNIQYVTDLLIADVQIFKVDFKVLGFFQSRDDALEVMKQVVEQSILRPAAPRLSRS